MRDSHTRLEDRPHRRDLRSVVNLTTDLAHTRLEDRPHHRDGLSTAPPGEDRSPGPIV